MSKRNIKPYGEASFNALYGKYKIKARLRELTFQLSKEEFKCLTKGKCVYCGIEPTKSFLNSGKETTNGNYIYNGIDRKNNKIGYQLDNCVSCCYTCNIAKQGMQVFEFLEWITKVYKFNE